MLILFFLVIFLLFFNVEGIQNNLNNEELQICSTDPMTGYTRNGKCELDETDQGTHTVCAEVTDDFLEFSREKGNDLITPNQNYRFPGLRDGDNWCLCAIRWKEAYDCAENPDNPNCPSISQEDVPKIIEDATHIRTLDFVPELSQNDVRERYIKEI